VGGIILSNVRGGFYGGSAVVPFLVLLAQAVGEFALLWAPALFCLAKGRRFSLLTGWLVGLSAVLVGAEIAAVFLIPVTGRC
jgi:hypothetical protein